MYSLASLLLAQLFFAQVTAYDKHNRLVKIWDELTFYNETTGAFEYSIRLKSFPYIADY